MKKERKSLGESLVEAGILTAEQLKQAEADEGYSGQRLRDTLVRLGFIAEEDLVTFLSDKLGLPRIDLANYIIDPKIVELVSEELARKYQVIPVLKIGNRLTCAMLDPWDIFAMDEIRAKTDMIIEPAIATAAEIRRALDEYYGAKGSMEDLIKSIDQERLDIKDGREIDTNKLKGIVEEPVVIKLVNLIIMKAIQERASDIHIEPEEGALKTRLRVDGMLHEISSPPKYLQSAIASRIKIMANLDIAERRKPQDGRFSIKAEGRNIDVRVSCVPTVHGENVVLRLLDISNAVLNLKDTGFSPGVLERYQRLISRPHGIILVTGPTGSGKTTTLYASLKKINTVEKNIVTIEDPVEYRLEGIRQIQINPKVDLTFATGLRSILRQDPDVIMVGEMRDFETAEIAVQAALTGHLVFSTLHTNDAPGAIARMLDMGIEPFLVSSAVIGVLAQRLVRTICPNCQAKGCPKCMNTGYKGRIGIFELMPIDDNIRDLIASKASADEIRKKALEAGMTGLKEDGMLKVKAGLTTQEEVLRVTKED
ncbi:MAG: GspE/PulE family protein [Candidatus Omnitrophica bacterium]|nr:GspE/PulE family protein [Candidatus Omnitrophota bacterium]